MTEAAAPQEAAPKKKSRKPLLLALIVAVAGGGGAFYATYSGLLGGSDTTADAGGHGDDPHAQGEDHDSSLSQVAFVPVTPLIISLGEESTSRHLRMTAQLEVGPSFVNEVTHLMPRILDIQNGYLRAIEVAELDDPAALVRIRSQLLRRIQIVTGEGRVRDLLITEFVLN